MCKVCSFEVWYKQRKVSKALSFKRSGYLFVKLVLEIDIGMFPKCFIFDLFRDVRVPLYSGISAKFWSLLRSL